MMEKQILAALEGADLISGERRWLRCIALDGGGVHISLITKPTWKPMRNELFIDCSMTRFEVYQDFINSKYDDKAETRRTEHAELYRQNWINARVHRWIAQIEQLST